MPTPASVFGEKPTASAAFTSEAGAFLSAAEAAAGGGLLGEDRVARSDADGDRDHGDQADRAEEDGPLGRPLPLADRRRRLPLLRLETTCLTHHFSFRALMS